MTEPNERVYPSTTQGSTRFSTLTHLGLTKREYFAAMAMQGILSNERCSGIEDLVQGQCWDVARASLVMADQLIEELNKS